MRAIDMHTTAAHPTEALREADRLMVVCNSCRYCEGLCAVFPAMERRRLFAERLIGSCMLAEHRGDSHRNFVARGRQRSRRRTRGGKMSTAQRQPEVV